MVLKMKPEFKVGKIVTYKPYEMKHMVRITEILKRGSHIEYVIVSDYTNAITDNTWGKPFTTPLRTTGASIMESKLYNGTLSSSKRNS